MIVVCARCLKAVMVFVSKDGNALLASVRDKDEMWPCVEDGCTGRMFHHAVIEGAVLEDPDRYRVEGMSSLEFFRAVKGFGTPSESLAADPEAVREMLQAQPAIVDAKLSRSNNKSRTIVEWLKIRTKQGLFTLHMGSGQGATIYKVTQDVGAEQAS